MRPTTFLFALLGLTGALLLGGPSGAANAASGAVPVPGMTGPTPIAATGTDSGMDGMADMPGMDHGAGGSSGGSTAHDHAAAVADPGDEGGDDSRPQGVVLGGFAVTNGLVLVSAAVVRRRRPVRRGGRS